MSLNAPEIQLRDPSTLVPYAKNAKRHPEGQIERLARTIAEFGFDQPIVIDRRGVIVKGHGRREAALILGLKQVPVIVTDLDEYQVMAARIADNKVVSEDYDAALLQTEVRAIADSGVDPALTGLGEVALDLYLSEEAEVVAIRKGKVLKGGLAKVPDARPTLYALFGDQRLEMTDEEMSRVSALLEDYTDDFGTRYGFIKFLCERMEQQ